MSIVNRKLSFYPLPAAYQLLFLPRELTVGQQKYQIQLEKSPLGSIIRGLLAWNNTLRYTDKRYSKEFLNQANFLRLSLRQVGGNSWGWLVPVKELPEGRQFLCMSALMQGGALSVLTRAYSYTHHSIWLKCAQRAVQAFRKDLFDGGICTPVGREGVYFAEWGIYPAFHHLIGCLIGILGLRDYLTLWNDSELSERLDHCLACVEQLVEHYQKGLWLYGDLHRTERLKPMHAKLQTSLLDLVGRRCQRPYLCSIAHQWRQKQQASWLFPRQQIANALFWGWQKALGWLQKCFYRPSSFQGVPRVAVIAPDFMLKGGVFTVLQGLHGVIGKRWQLEYLARLLGDEEREGRYTTHQFGSRLGTPWYFPLVLVYIGEGIRKLLALWRAGCGYHLLLPQDGVFTGFLAGCVGKLFGIRVICIDHGNLSFFTRRNWRVYRQEYLQILQQKPWPWMGRWLVQGFGLLYLPSLWLMAKCTARMVDHYLVPGVPEDSIDEGCMRLKIPLERVTRYASMINMRDYAEIPLLQQWRKRSQWGCTRRTRIVAIVCRLSPEKGVDLALRSFQQALEHCNERERQHVRLLIAGDGPSRQQLEQLVDELNVRTYCHFLGELCAEDVRHLLLCSDIFLYASTRGACMAMAVLEAMAAGCVVIASKEPLSNLVLLAEGRGFAKERGDCEGMAEALAYLIRERYQCGQMGRAARAYISQYHTPEQFCRTILRATLWQPEYCAHEGVE